MQEDLRKLKKRTGEASDSESDDDHKRKRRIGPSYLELELAKYSKGRGRAAKAGNKRGRRDEEEDLLAEMSKFSRKVTELPDDDDDDDGEGQDGRDRSQPAADGEEGIDVDDDVGWMKHKLKFEVDEKELTRRAEEEYAVCVHRAFEGLSTQSHRSSILEPKRGSWRTRSDADQVHHALAPDLAKAGASEARQCSIFSYGPCLVPGGEVRGPLATWLVDRTIIVSSSQIKML